MSETPADASLSRWLKDEIRRSGAMPVSRFMDACLCHPEWGYYRRRPVLGAAADFVTAPEISQVFGELIGLWCAVVWQLMGQPPRLHLVELGPGRGTLMADALRSARALPAFRAALDVHLVEVNAPLRTEQHARLGDSGVAMSWHDCLPSAGDFAGAPVIVIGNEFLDALPVDQTIFRDGVWRKRAIGINAEGDFTFVEDVAIELAATRSSANGDIQTYSEAQRALIADLGGLADRGQMAALLIDYGAVACDPVDTLQGVQRHQYVSPLSAPGYVDLTAHVDFGDLIRVASTRGLSVDGPVPQAEFLGALGIAHRASRLMALNPDRGGEIEAGVARLMAPNGMGTRFKAMAVRSPALPPLPGLAAT